MGRPFCRTRAAFHHDLLHLGDGLPTAAAACEGKPSIVLILVDDLGYGSLGCYRSNQIRTPHPDRPAASDMRITDFHSNSPVCTPTRAALMTGRYPQRCAWVPDELRRLTGGAFDHHTHVATHGLKQLDWRHGEEIRNENGYTTGSRSKQCSIVWGINEGPTSILQRTCLNSP